MNVKYNVIFTVILKNIEEYMLTPTMIKKVHKTNKTITDITKKYSSRLLHLHTGYSPNSTRTCIACQEWLIPMEWGRPETNGASSFYFLYTIYLDLLTGDSCAIPTGVLVWPEGSQLCLGSWPSGGSGAVLCSLCPWLCSLTWERSHMGRYMNCHPIRSSKHLQWSKLVHFTCIGCRKQQ
jgi:hypothetical protein